MKAVFVPFGTGNNGKTTLLSTFLLQSDVLIARQESNNTQADPAGLRGALFVMTSETEEGQRLSQGKLKRITEGTGKIKATRNYENRIKYPETHKLWMDTNSKPMVRAADDQAIFNRCIRSRSRSRSRPRRLTRACRGNCSRKPKASWRGRAGAREWRQTGLGKSPEVVAANDDWRSGNDHL